LKKKRSNQLKTTTFVDNLSSPIHRWFRYSAGFSASWVNQLISEHSKNKEINVFDPFAGAGTVLIQSERCGVNSIGIESHPFVAKIAQSKLYWRENPTEFKNFAFSILEKAKKNKSFLSEYPPLIEKCFSKEGLTQLDKLRKELFKNEDGSNSYHLTWLALVSILRECSGVGTAPWQYILPKKKKSNPKIPFEAFESKINLMSEDMTTRQKEKPGPSAKLLQEDVREKISVSRNWADLLITSPPYANNFDYADTTRLEMSFLKDIQSWGDLQETVRKHLIHSCTQHVSSRVKETYSILENVLLKPIKDEIIATCQELDSEKEHHGGKKNYHTMIAFYFYDMAKTWNEIRKIMKKNSLVCFVIGDSAPYGIYVPVDEWLGKLAVGRGFKSFHFEKTRDRNVKWHNRKHKVPLHEGRLWVRG